ncbi:nitrogen fixation protein NifQ [Acidiferrobacter sp.]|uniref:nitrogen fixation protein NifQ n=1 Tax=Acidiferrobacter sp. TaxID=1872107 RepID=UPI0026348932|nr:nitrogen fixation protein NifQ [Acidiferrobacter sp.]
MTVDRSRDTLTPKARPADPIVARAFAGVLSRFHTLGLDSREFSALRRRHLAGPAGDVAAPEACGCDPLRAEEHGELVELLLAHRADRSRETRWLAFTIATACLGDNHLWQDMGLNGREELSGLLRWHFTALYERNVHNMKWKKFFYKELCRQAQVTLCKAPSCRVCTDYAACFGPE